MTQLDLPLLLTEGQADRLLEVSRLDVADLLSRTRSPSVRAGIREAYSCFRVTVILGAR